MNFIRRIALWIGMNIAVILLFSVITSLLGINGYISAAGGIEYQNLLIFAGIFGFLGSFVSLLASKWMAKRAFRVKVIKNAQNYDETKLLEVVSRISAQIGITPPEVGIYNAPEVNAFATGAFKNSALVAVSTGLLNTMNSDEIEGVLAHEMAHVANGDMVTMTLLQGVINTFVIFVSRILAHAVAQRNENMGNFAYFGMVMAFEVVFGMLASLLLFWFSRWREFRADEGGARFVGKQKMLSALIKLQNHHGKGITAQKHKAFQTIQLNGMKGGFLNLFRTHPTLEKRIAALKKMQIS